MQQCNNAKLKAELKQNQTKTKSQTKRKRETKMAKYATHKDTKEYKNEITIARRRIRDSKYSTLFPNTDDAASDKALRAIAREVHATVAPFVYVPASPEPEHLPSSAHHKRITHNLVLRGA